MSLPDLTSPPAPPLSQLVAQQLRELIFKDQRFSPGDRIPNERSLAKELGVSRASLREAIKILAANGVLVIRRGVGTFVSETPGRQNDPFGFSFVDDRKKLLSDWYQVRMILESEAMEMVAKNATNEELQKLEALAEEQISLLGKSGSSKSEVSPRSFFEVDHDFHSALASATHSYVMSRVLPALHEWVYFGMAVGEYPRLSQQMQRNAQDSHRAIVSFLKKRDGKGANLAMRYHMLRALEDIQQ